ncbi:VOC family protein [Pedococcus sp. 5OH_020]|uniref:VOC family protein n=1 Tax=Pedococcus sp. 5OH_020 TaxID=2989814 RepID=UPI0022E9ACCF|nr:VOC family protein [Pedococcus sp. 5OH_020]
MYLENLVFDAVDPQRLGRYWEKALGTETLSDSEEAYETRLTVPGGPVLDLCFQRVPQPAVDGSRLHLDLRGDDQQDEVVARLLALGASPADIGQRDVPWVVLADPEGNPFCVMEARAAYSDTGPIAAVPMDSADPQRDAAFWAALTGWAPVDGVADATLRHPSLRGMLLELCAEKSAKSAAKNRLHLDLRLESEDDPDAVLPRVLDLGAHVLDHDFGDLPWTILTDPSGNEFCILPARA